MKWINENLYISPINTYIDPSKPVENAIITHGHADHAKPGHKNVLATKAVSYTHLRAHETQ